MQKAQKKKRLLDYLNYFKEKMSLIQSNIQIDENELREMDRLGKERGIKQPLIIPFFNYLKHTEVMIWRLRRPTLI